MGSIYLVDVCMTGGYKSVRLCDMTTNPAISQRILDEHYTLLTTDRVVVLRNT